MRYFSLPLVFSLFVSIIAEAGVTSRALRAALSSSHKKNAPLLSELDVSDALARSRQRLFNEKSGEIDMVFARPTSQLQNENLYFRASVSQNLETLDKNMMLSLDIRGVDHVTRNRVKAMVKNSDWDIVGHFSSKRIVKYSETGDSLLLNIEVSSLNRIDHDSYRGIKKLVDGVLRVSLDSGNSSKLRPFLTRRSVYEAPNAGAR